MNIEFEINRYTLNNVIQSHKKFIAECSTENLLSCFHFELNNNSLKVYTTDGNRCLKSVVQVNNISKKDGSFNIDAALITNLVIVKNKIDDLHITVDDKSIIFKDNAVSTLQKYNLFRGIYPNVETLLKSYDYKENNHTITLNHKFFNNLNALTSNKYTNALELTINKEDNTKPIIAKTKNDDLEQTALLLPLQVRN